MRRILDQLYRVSGLLAAFFLLAICLTVMAQVGANMIDSFAKNFLGEPIGLIVPSYSEFTGYFLVAASFLALAYSLRHGAHIRVTLLIRALGPIPRRWVEVWCCGFGAIFSAFFTWHSIWLVWDSYTYNDISPGMVPVPIWIPQSAMALGLVILTIALLDELLAVLRGRTPGYIDGDEFESGRSAAGGGD